MLHHEIASCYEEGSFRSLGRHFAAKLRWKEWHLYLIGGHLDPSNDVDAYEESLSDFAELLSLAPRGYKVIVGLDASCSIGRQEPDANQRLVGHIATGTHSWKSNLFMRVCLEYSLSLENTHYDDPNLHYTCHYYCKRPAAQIDYIGTTLPRHSIVSAQTLESCAAS